MKKFLNFKTLFISSLLIASTVLTSCSNGDVIENQSEVPQEEITLTVGATSVPHAVLLEQVVDILKEDNINLVITESDYAILNPGTVDGTFDANFFQHMPYLDNFNENSGTSLVSVGAVHIEPLGIYSQNISSLDDLKEGDFVSIPNDGSNETRALKLLESQGIIKLDSSQTGDLTPMHIVENPLNLVFVEMEAVTLIPAITDVALAVINGNYAIQGGFNPATDALVLESATDSPYANVLVSTEDNANSEAVLTLYEALTSEKIKNFIDETYSGSVIPAFN